jgi:Ca2+-binding EF-hand superfamily protein
MTAEVKMERSWLDPFQYYEMLRQSLTELRPPEFVEYIHWNLTGTGSGWFHPGQSRYDWKWLAERYDRNHDGKITRQEFEGPAEFFDRLDCNHDGILTAADFDWTDPQPEQMRALLAGPGQGRRQMPGLGQGAGQTELLSRLPEMMGRLLFNKIDSNSDGRISREEWLAVFTRAAKGKDYLTPEDLREALPLTLPNRARNRGALPALASVALVRISGMFKGETGSILEGPQVGERAPDFSLKTQDGRQTIRLSDFRGHKPLVLVFGNFT